MFMLMLIPPSTAVCSTPAITIVGNVTIDLVDGKKALGGAVSYAAAVASAFGVRACIVTAAAPDVDLGTVFDVSPFRAGWQRLCGLAHY